MQTIRKEYSEPELEIIRFEEDDVITTSGGWDELDEDELPIIRY